MGEFGLIETIKVVNGRIVFRNLHVKRLHRSLKVINIDESEYKLEDRILRLLKYECIEKGLKNFRLRLEVQKNRAHDYMPELSQLKWNCVLRPLENPVYQLNELGLSLTFLPKHKKMLDAFSNLKHTDRSIYEKAIRYARENDFDDALVLNENNTVADASIYNVFVVKDNVIYTPPLSDGPVAGVLRELLLTRLPTIRILEKSLTIQDVYAADEVFLTNSIFNIRWVQSIGDKNYTNQVVQKIYSGIFSTILQ